MKILSAAVLLLVMGLVVEDLFHVANLWHSYRPQDLVTHGAFWAGAMLITAANSYFMLVCPPAKRLSRALLLVSFVAQLSVVAVFSKLVVVAWKRYWFEAESATAVTVSLEFMALPLLLLVVMAALLLWSARLR